MHDFDTETRVRAIGDGLYAGHVHAAYNIGANPNGGYLMAIVVAALRASAPRHPDPLSMTAHFLRPATPGADCEVRVATLRSGRTLDTVRASLLQEGKVRLEVMAAFGVLADPAPAALTIDPPRLPSPPDCVARSGAAQGIALPILDRLQIRLDPADTGPDAAPRARTAGWIRFADGREPDTHASTLFVDAFPPAVFGLLGAVGWVPTIELTLHLRARPAAGWVLGEFTSHDLCDGRMIEDGRLWDSQGRLIAQSRQLGLVRSA